MAEQHYISNAGETLIEGRKFLESNTSNASTQKLGLPFVGGSSLASNIFMVLVILLSAVMCALCLDSILRCALHWTRSLAVETPEEFATVSGNSIHNDNPGLRRMFVLEIPILIYAAQGSKLPDNIGMDCPICLGEFTEGEQVRVLPKCNHSFHADCIDTWLLSNSSCPTCRRCLLDSCNTGCQRGDSSASCVIDRQDSSRSSRRGSSHEFNLHMI